MYLLSEHAILVKVVLRESILETAILQNSNDFIEFVCSDIELNCFKYGSVANLAALGCVRFRFLTFLTRKILLF